MHSLCPDIDKVVPTTAQKFRSLNYVQNQAKSFNEASLEKHQIRVRALIEEPQQYDHKSTFATKNITSTVAETISPSMKSTLETPGPVPGSNIKVAMVNR